MRVLLGVLGSIVLCLPLVACDMQTPLEGDCFVVASNCASATTPDGCTCEGSNGTTWVCEYEEGSDENCCEDDENACTDEEEEE